MIDLFRQVQRRLLTLTGIAAVVGVGIGLLVAQAAGAWGALMAAGFGLAFTFTTIALLRLVAGRGPELLQVVLLGGWILKLVLVVLIMLWLANQDFYHRGVFFGTLVAVVLGAIAIEIWSVATTRMPYVDAATDQVSRVTPDAEAKPSQGAAKADLQGLDAPDDGDGDGSGPVRPATPS